MLASILTQVSLGASPRQNSSATCVTSVVEPHVALLQQQAFVGGKVPVEKEVGVAGAWDKLCDLAARPWPERSDDMVYGAAHYLLDASECPPSVVDSAGKLGEAMRRMAEGVGVPPEVGTTQKEFMPQGVTILHLLQTGHVTVHTWPEEGAALFDVLVPAETMTLPDEAERVLRGVASGLGCAKVLFQRLPRGPAPKVAGAMDRRWPPPEKQLAKHVLIDATGCSTARLASSMALIGAADDAARASNLTEVGMLTRFPTASPDRRWVGAWADSHHVAKLMEESHVAVHALPGAGTVYVDVMTCAPLSAAQVLELERLSLDRFGCESVAATLWERGL